MHPLCPVLTPYVRFLQIFALLGKGLRLPTKSFTIHIAKVRPLENILSTEGGKTLRGRLDKNLRKENLNEKTTNLGFTATGHVGKFQGHR